MNEDIASRCCAFCGEPTWSMELSRWCNTCRAVRPVRFRPGRQSDFIAAIHDEYRRLTAERRPSFAFVLAEGSGVATSKRLPSARGVGTAAMRKGLRREAERDHRHGLERS